MIGEVLGKGAFSTVRLAVSKTTNKKWAGDNVILFMFTCIVVFVFMVVMKRMIMMIMGL